MLYIYYFIFGIGYAQEAPSTREICLQENSSQRTMITSSQCQWPPKKEKTPEKYGCSGALFDCLTQGEMNIKFSVCTKSELFGEGLVTDVAKESHLTEQREACKARSAALKKCFYNSNRIDGYAAGDDPSITDEDCRVPLKKNFQGIQK